jgi:hypothetical protein
MRWKYEREKRLHETHPRGFRVRIVQIRRTARMWTVERVRQGHVRCVASGEMPTVAAAKAVAESVVCAMRQEAAWGSV